MNAINALVTKVFDLGLAAIEWAGVQVSLVVVSGIFGILALIAFKHISYQRGIKATKDKIKGHLIEIRIYQDDIGVASKAIAKVLLRNAQYVAYNFGPFVPLAIPFVFVLAQLVVRYGFAPIPVVDASRMELVAGPNGSHLRPELLPGQGTLLTIEFADDRAADASGLSIRLPEGLVAVSPLVRAPSVGKAFQEIAATRAGAYDVVLELPGGRQETKRIVAGNESRERMMQPERVRGAWSAMLWPAEKTFDAASGLKHVSFEYPESDLGWMPGGPFGIVIVFLVASMAFGIALLKPLGIQI
jgi:hypothetical protein